jgi:hypothetical protein
MRKEFSGMPDRYKRPNNVETRVREIGCAGLIILGALGTGVCVGSPIISEQLIKIFSCEDNPQTSINECR